jgi:transcriptional regulator with XRE-family HTH domain
MSEIRLKSGHYRSFSSRIKFVIEKLSSKREFVETTGIPEERVDELLSGSDPTLAELESINSGYRQILEKWLLTGEGVPLRDSPKELKSLSDYSGICQRFREERIRNNYTQQEWADIFGRARATIAAIETGRQVFPFDVLRKWHVKFGRSYGFIIDGTEEDVDLSRMIARIEELEQDKEFLKNLLEKTK